MTLALILLVGAALVAVLAPSVLERMTLSAMRPSVVLASWLASMASVLFFGCSAVVILFWPEHAPAEGMIDTIVRCFSAVQHTARPWIGESLAVAGIVTVMALAARVVFFARRQSTARAQMQDFHRDVVAIVARREPDRGDVMWLDHPLPMAYSVSGRPGFVVATEGLSSSLSSVERDAVLAHERAHLSGHHHRIVSICDVLAKVFPRVPLFARAPGAVKTVIELAADQQAAKATSPAVVSSALAAVADAALPQPAWTLGLGNDTTLRLWRLRVAPQTRYSRLACCAAAAVTITLPAFAALVVVLVFSTAACIMVA
ncbi:M56 family metallopeptidase (plasmid) [Rhodococcus pseudokoreensis]|uniref:M56 family metallopeptidase n=1 Tax=Rhodococcus pseudokoreensis TaxID=2811421 RepID=A0A974ZRF1_9NOCA|nr:M56 family metallopeptidase [Rhodococcus pseudokoreensis]QSE87626.1 M56 family metallopeptidase [Rhodococcus pseudokoreensis]